MVPYPLGSCHPGLVCVTLWSSNTSGGRPSIMTLKSFCLPRLGPIQTLKKSPIWLPFSPLLVLHLTWVSHFVSRFWGLQIALPLYSLSLILFPIINSFIYSSSWHCLRAISQSAAWFPSPIQQPDGEVKPASNLWASGIQHPSWNLVCNEYAYDSLIKVPREGVLLLMLLSGSATWWRPFSAQHHSLLWKCANNCRTSV